jgi:hypothetical protein
MEAVLPPKGFGSPTPVITAEPVDPASSGPVVTLDPSSTPVNTELMAARRSEPIDVVLLFGETLDAANRTPSITEPVEVPSGPVSSGPVVTLDPSSTPVTTELMAARRSEPIDVVLLFGETIDAANRTPPITEPVEVPSGPVSSGPVVTLCTSSFRSTGVTREPVRIPAVDESRTTPATIEPVDRPVKFAI